MTTKQYRTSMGKTVDMGALMLQNETARAVGNMSVNARGDRLDSNNQVIDRKSKQAQRQYQKQSNVSGEALASQSLKKSTPAPMQSDDSFNDLPDDNDIVRDESNAAELQGGLAAAIAKAKTVQQTKLTPLKQPAKSTDSIRKI